MKNKLFTLILFVMIAAGTSAQAAARTNQGGLNDGSDEIIVYRLPEPKRVYIYRNAYNVFEAVIQSNAVIGNTFILPENVDTERLSIS